MSEIPERPSWLKRIVLWVVFLAILVPGGYGFIEKFIQFVRTLNSAEGGGFTIVPICNYLLMAMGFACLLAWAIAHGMLRDVEKPKYTMLENERRLQELEGDTWDDSQR
jgi:hypothetical protein